MNKEEHSAFLKLTKENAVNSPVNDAVYLKFVVISDTHEQMDKIMDRIPDGDVLIHCGDFTNDGDYLAISNFNEQLGASRIAIKLLEDFRQDKLNVLTNCQLLLNEQIKIEGIKIYATSFHITPNYAFYMHPSKISNEWAKIPEDTDILITHGPPKGYLDYGSRDRNYGDVELLKAVEARNIKFHVFGHIHEGYGAARNGSTTFINAAQMDWDKGPCRKPIVFYCKIPQK